MVGLVAYMIIRCRRQVPNVPLDADPQIRYEQCRDMTMNAAASDAVTRPMQELALLGGPGVPMAVEILTREGTHKDIEMVEGEGGPQPMDMRPQAIWNGMNSNRWRVSGLSGLVAAFSPKPD